MTDDPITWLRAQLDEDERIANAAAAGNPHWRADDDGDVSAEGTGGNGYLANGPWGGSLWEAGHHIARHDPARVLAEVDAKRRILDEHKTYDVHSGFGCGICAFNGWDKVIEPEGWCTTVRLLALPYADQPGYRSEWAP